MTVQFVFLRPQGVLHQALLGGRSVLSLHQTELTAGTSTGVVSYNSTTWRENNRQKIFNAGGVLWLDVVDLEGERTRVS